MDEAIETIQPIIPASAEFTMIDKSLAAAMLVCGFLYWNLIIPGSLGAGVTVFAIILCTVIGLYLKKSGISQFRESIFLMAIIALSAVNFILFDNMVTKGLNFVFLSALVVYWIGLATGRRLDSKLSVYIIGDLINQTLAIPFANFSCCFAALKHGGAQNELRKSVTKALVGILVVLPVLSMVISLLINADAAFASLVGNIRFSLSSSMVEHLIQVVLGIPVACYLYGLVYGDRYARHTRHMTVASVDRNAQAMQFAPVITVCAAMTALNAIYLVFFLAQSAYLFSAFGSNLPETMTYAGYARRGFFELCQVAGINLGAIAAAYLLTNRNNEPSASHRGASKMLRLETTVLCAFTLMLIGTALSKMAMYIHYYGLTQLRIFTTWFMVLLFVVFIIVAVRQFRSFNAARLIIISLMIGFLVLSYGNTDGMIAKYNIDRYQAGTLKTIDVSALAELSDAAVPYLYHFYLRTGDAALKGQLKEAISGLSGEGETMLPKEATFRDLNWQQYKADQIRAALAAVNLASN